MIIDIIAIATAMAAIAPYVVPIPDPFGQAIVVHEVIFLLPVVPAHESARLLP